MSNQGLEWTVITSAVKLKEISGGQVPSGTQLIPNTVAIYAKDKAGVSNLYWKNDAGTEFDIGALTSASGGANRIAYFSSATDLTSSATFVFDGTSMGLGTATPNYAGFTRTLTIESGTNTALEFSSSRADAANVLIGAVAAWYKTNSVNHNRIAEIDFVTDGTTANQRGGSIQFLVKVNGSTNFSERLRLDNLGTLVVGGGAVQSDLSGNSIETHPTVGSAGGSAVYCLGFGSGSAGNFQGRSARGTSGSPTALGTDDLIAAFTARGYGATGYAGSFRAAMQMFAAENWSDTVQGTYIKLLTTPTGSATPAERFRIGPAGQLGIGGATFGTAGQYHRSGGASAATTWATITSSEVTPPGSTTQIIFNSAGAFGASANLTWDGTDLAVASGSRFRMQSQNRIRYLNSMARVTRTTDKTISTSTWTVIDWDSEDFDTDSLHDTVTNNSRILCNLTGKYRISFRIAWAANATGFRFAAVRKNAAGAIGSGTALFIKFWLPDPSGTQGDFEGLEGIVALTSGDYIEGFVFQNSGGNLSCLTSSGVSNWPAYLSLAYIGE
jgi:hypothetical protein